jgi:putative FmdB family regulatory protein
MPFYSYECSSCNNQFESVHSITEQLHNCDRCGGTDTLKRVPQLLTSYSKQKSEKDLAGERVNKAIEDNRKLLLDHKHQIDREYKP